ncbi:MAG: helix-turn-helix transcriptional regulator [Bacteroidales bacterium]|nr:helix-turn-helix transcriptional regulator [Bacteroidales bacterium]
MKERIIQFLSENNLTSTRFADVIGVQRSSISHILSGRNKPSYDFIEKMLIAYPDLNAQWLITGNGDMYTNPPSLFDQKDSDLNNDLTQRELNIQNQLSSHTDISNSEVQTENKKENTSKVEDKSTDIERVMIFYKDGSFKDYKPDK